MTKFSIEGFAAGCKQVMAGAQSPQRAAQAYLQQALRTHEPAEIIEALEAAIPPGAAIGEMIVHGSPELTMLYARVPARFQSGIHNHTVFACIGQLAGQERSVIYEKAEGGLRVRETMLVETGEVMTLPADVIHHIENPNDETGRALHLYGGDFAALMNERSLWSSEDHQEGPFSFEALLVQSVAQMKKARNERGIAEIVRAIPAARSLAEAAESHESA